MTERDGQKQDQRQTGTRKVSRVLVSVRRILRRTLQIVLVILVLLLVTTSILLGTRPGRQALLDRAVPIVLQKLPGEATVQEVRWPVLKRLELRDLCWRDANGDTLVAATHLDVAVNLKDLWQKDLYAEEIRASGLLVNLPVLQTQLATLNADAAVKDSSLTTAASDSAAGGAFGFPRPGALEGIPSVGLGELQITAARLRLDPSQTVEVEDLTISAELRHDHQPRLAAHMRLQLRPDLIFATRLQASLGDSLVLQLAPLYLGLLESADLPTPDTLPLTGRLSVDRDELASLQTLPAVTISGLEVAGDLGEVRLDGQVARGGGGTVRLRASRPRSRSDFLLAVASLVGKEITMPDMADTLWTRWTPSAGPDVDILCRMQPASAAEPFRPAHVAVTGSFALPGPAALQPLLPQELVVDDLGTLRGSLDVAIDLSAPQISYRGTLDLGATDWLDTALVSGYGQANQVHLDTLALNLPGLNVAAAGDIDPHSVDATAHIRIPDSTLLARWPNEFTTDAGVFLDLTVKARGPFAHLQVVPAGSTTPLHPAQVAVNGSFVLPGPATLKPYLPQQLVVDDLETLRGNLDVAIELSAPQISYRGTVDLGATDWLDTALVSGYGQANQVHLDTLALKLPGLNLTAAGDFDPHTVNATMHISIPDSSLLARWQDELTADVGIRLDLSARARGPLAHPQGEMSLAASVRKGNNVIPQLELQAQARADSMVLNLNTPQGFTLDSHALTSLQAHYSGDLPDTSGSLKGEFRVAARTLEHRMATSGRVDLGETNFLEVDSLALAWRDRQLAATRPFQLVQDTTASFYQISNLDLAGDPGRIWGEGTIRPDSIDVHLGVDLNVVAGALREFVPTLPLFLADEDTLLLAGSLDLQEHEGSPLGFCELKAGIQGHEDLSALGVEISTWLLPDRFESTTAPWQLKHVEPARISPPDTAEWPGLTANLKVTHGDTTLVAGSARYPVRLSLLPLQWQPVTDQRARVRIHSREIELAELSAYLPRGLSMEGAFRLEATAEGVGDDLQLTGQINTTKMTGRMEDGSRVTLDSQIALAGTIRKPEIQGQVTVQNGLIRLPGMPTELLPTEGESLLWEAAAADTAGNGMMAELAARMEDQAKAATNAALAGTDSLVVAPAFMPQLALKLSVPGDLWVRGQGLNMQLTGDLDVGLREGLPTVSGHLEAFEGNFRLLGRIFEFEWGKVTFRGDELELNPELDLSLITIVEGAQIRVQLLGTAKEPELVLKSDPFMSEADIISMLLFGQRMFELDSGQEDLLQTRSTEILASYGAVQLQDRLGSQMGIDIISIGQSTDRNSEMGSLIIGKYLNPKLLIKYEKVLDRDTAYFMHLIYSLTRYFKVTTTYSQGDRSGITVNWMKDY